MYYYWCHSYLFHVFFGDEIASSWSPATSTTVGPSRNSGRTTYFSVTAFGIAIAFTSVTAFVLVTTFSVVTAFRSREKVFEVWSVFGGEVSREWSNSRPPRLRTTFKRVGLARY